MEVCQQVICTHGWAVAFYRNQISQPSSFWRSSVFFLYVDESGQFDDADDHFVVGGLAIDEADLDLLRARVASAMARHLDPHLRGIEIHAQHMLKGKGPWRSVPKEVREALVLDLCRTLTRFQRQSSGPFGLFSTAKSPGSIPGVNALERTFEELFLRFHEMLLRIGPNGPSPRGIVIADKARYESTLQPITTKWREEGTRFKKLRRIAEVPLFCDSKATLFVQLADLVAHGVYLAYARRDGGLLDALLPGFDHHDGVIHGLVHLSANHRRCACMACATRRAARRSPSPKG